MCHLELFIYTNWANSSMKQTYYTSHISLKYQPKFFLKKSKVTCRINHNFTENFDRTLLRFLSKERLFLYQLPLNE